MVSVGGRTPTSSGLDLRGGAHHPQAGQVVLVGEEEVNGGEAGLNGQDVRGGAREAIGGPPLDLVPEGRELSRHVYRGLKCIRAVAEDGKEKRGGQTMAQKRGQAHPWRGEPFDGHESSLGFGKPLGKVWGGGDRGGEPGSQPPDLVFRGKDRPVQVDRGAGDRASVPIGSPVDRFRFGDGEADTQAGPSGLQHCVMPL